MDEPQEPPDVDEMDEPHEPKEFGKLFWAGAVIGWAVIVFGLVGLFSDSDTTKPLSFGLWFGGAAIVHDMIWLPIALAAGLVIGRYVPAVVRAPLAWCLGTSAALIAVAFPFVLGRGRNATVPSLLPRNYAHGLLVYLAVVVAVAVGWAAVSILAARRTSHSAAGSTTE